MNSKIRLSRATDEQLRQGETIEIVLVHKDRSYSFQQELDWDWRHDEVIFDLELELLKCSSKLDLGSVNLNDYRMMVDVKPDKSIKVKRDKDLARIILDFPELIPLKIRLEKKDPSEDSDSDSEESDSEESDSDSDSDSEDSEEDSDSKDSDSGDPKSEVIKRLVGYISDDAEVVIQNISGTGVLPGPLFGSISGNSKISIDGVHIGDKIKIKVKSRN